MANVDHDGIVNSRIWNNATDWTAQAAEDTNVPGWTIGDPFIFGCNVYSLIEAVACNKGYNGAQFKLQFEASDDPGVWTDVGAATEIMWGADANLTDDASDTTSRLSTIAVCGTGFLSSNYNKEDNTLPDSGTNSGASEQWIETYFSLDTDNARGGITYTLKLYNVTASKDCGGGLATITMAAGAPPVTITTSIDSLLQKAGISPTSSLDAILKKLNLTETSSLDALIKKAGGADISLDAILQHIDLTAIAALDAL